MEWRDKPKNPLKKKQPLKESDYFHSGAWKYLGVLLSEEILLGEGDVKMRPEVKFIRMINLNCIDLFFK